MTPLRPVAAVLADFFLDQWPPQAQRGTAVAEEARDRPEPWTGEPLRRLDDGRGGS